MTGDERRRAAERRMWAALKDEMDAIRDRDEVKEAGAMAVKWVSNRQAFDYREALHRSKP